MNGVTTCSTKATAIFFARLNYQSCLSMHTESASRGWSLHGVLPKVVLQHPACMVPVSSLFMEDAWEMRTTSGLDRNVKGNVHQDKCMQH